MKFLIWDMDGTLIDSKKDILLSLRTTFDILRIDTSTQSKELIVGPPLREALLQAFPKNFLSNTDIKKILSVFRHIYDTCEYPNTHLYEQIDTIVKNTEFYTHYIVTNKSDVASNRIIKKLGLTDFINQVITPYTFPNKLRSKSEIFKYLIETENLVKNHTYGIGDMYTDYLAGQSAGIQTIGVLWGNGTREELTAADCQCSTVSELKVLLETVCIK